MSPSWVGSGSAVSWAVSVQVNDSKIIYNDIGQSLPIVCLHYVPAFGTQGYKLKSVNIVSEIPLNAVKGATSGTYYFPSGDKQPYSNNYLIYDPVIDTVYVSGNRSGNVGLITSVIINDFVNSYVYKSYAFKQGSVGPPMIDVSGLLLQLLNALKAPLALLFGVMITLKIVGWGSTRLIRGFENKDSDRKLAQIMKEEDPLAFKTKLNQHRKDYNARMRRYKREDKRRGF